MIRQNVKLIDYEELIESGFCSLDFLLMLNKNHNDNDIQIFLSLFSGTYSIEELSSITRLSTEEIKNICKIFYNNYIADYRNEVSSGYGWTDSGRHTLNPKMGSYKGY